MRGRFVAVNLMLTTKDTLMAGLDTHICELQLTLDSFNKILV